MSYKNNLDKVDPNNLEAFSVDDGWTRLVIFLFGDPHLLECGKGSQDGSTDPDGVFPLWWSDDLDLHSWWGEGGDFFLHTISNTREHGRTSRKTVLAYKSLRM